MAGSTLRSGGPAACTDVSIRNALEQATMSSRPSCPRRSSSAAPTAAGASRMPEVRHSTWLAGLAIPNFTLAHPKNAEVLCASTLAAVVLPRARRHVLQGFVRRKAFAPVILRRLLAISGLQRAGPSGGWLGDMHPRPSEFWTMPGAGPACGLQVERHPLEGVSLQNFEVRAVLVGDR